MDADFTGEPLTIGFNPTFLLDGLAAVNRARADGVHDAVKPAVHLAPAGEDGEVELREYRYLIMPVRVVPADRAPAPTAGRTDE